MKKYIAYYRVSTQRQGQSGLGLEAQKTIVNNFIKSHGGEIVKNYTEVESGKNEKNRPNLQSALKECATNGYTLLVAKLDRLARNLHFITTLMESNIDFIACDIPSANNFTIHIFATLAEMERDMISTRTKEALKCLKERGIKLGNPNATFTDGMRQKSAKVLKEKRLNNENNKNAKRIISFMKDTHTLQEIADYLNNEGLVSSRGGKFYPSTITNLLK